MARLTLAAVLAAIALAESATVALACTAGGGDPFRNGGKELPCCHSTRKCLKESLGWQWRCQSCGDATGCVTVALGSSPAFIFSQCRSHFKKDRGNLFPVQSTRRVEAGHPASPSKSDLPRGHWNLLPAELRGVCRRRTCTTRAPVSCAATRYRTTPVVLGSELGVRL